MKLQVSGLTKRFSTGRGDEHAVLAVDHISFEVRAGEMFTLLGPSGCGKTTTLRSIAGLEHPDEGEIVIDGRTMFNSRDGVRVPANRRGLGMVFQSYAIWPHMTVAENVAFPLRALPSSRRPSSKEIRRRVMRVLETVLLDHAADRRATRLSGGQQQRLALARGLVVEPPLLLLDEPLSNLDLQLREEMRVEIRRVQRELGITAIYVTHDQGEALALSSRIAVMNAGHIEQLGTPEEIYAAPASLFVAGFIGSSNRLPGRVKESGPDLTAVETDQGLLHGRTPPGARLAPGDETTFFVRPEDLELRPRGETSDPLLGDGVVVDRSYLGDALEYLVRVRDQELRIRGRVTDTFASQSEVTVTYTPERCQVIAGHGEG